MKPKFTDSQIKEIYINEYAKGVSSSKLGEKYGVGRGYFTKRFKKMNMDVRTQKEVTKKYQLNEEYFDIIDSHEKAYWLGFIYADGYVTTSKNKSNTKRVGISLHIKDKSHLECFKRCLNSNYPIYDYTTIGGYKKGTPYCRLIFSSDKMYDELVKKGVFEHKSTILKPPTCLDEEFIKSFLLGYFDGDGCLCKNNGKKKFTRSSWAVKLCGTYDFMYFFMDYLVSKNIVDHHNEISLDKRTKGTYGFSYTGINAYEIMKHLYQDVDKKIVLKRKYELYLELCKNY